MQMYGDDDSQEIPLSKFESMLKTNKILFFDSEEFEGIILHYLEEGKVSLAKKALKLALEQHPLSTNIKLVQVDLLIYSSKFDMAEKILAELEIIEPKNEDIYLQRANIHSRRNEHDLSVKQLLIALEISEDPTNIYSLLGMEFLYLDDVMKAKDCFIKALENEDRDEDHSSLFNVVYCFDFLDQNIEAIAFLDQYINKNPYSEIAWHQLGREYFILLEYDKAIEAFDYAILIDEQFVGAYTEKAKCLEKLGKYKKAIQTYIITLELEDPTPFSLLRIGKCYEKLKHREAAIQYYLKAITEDPMLQRAWLAIFKFYKKEKNYKKSLYYINKAIAIDQENPHYWIKYAKINFKLQFYEECIIGYNNAILHGEYRLKSWLSLADTLLILGEYEIGIEALDKSCELYPNDIKIEYRLAGLHYLTRNKDKSVLCLLNALSINYNKLHIFENLFPTIQEDPIIKQTIRDFHTNNPLSGL